MANCFFLFLHIQQTLRSDYVCYMTQLIYQSKLNYRVYVFNSVITSKFNIQWARDIVYIKFVLIKQCPNIKVLHLYLPCWGQSDFAVPPHHASSAHCPAPVVIVWSWQFLWHTYCSGQSKCTPLLPPLLMAVSVVLFDNLAKKI